MPSPSVGTESDDLRLAARARRCQLLSAVTVRVAARCRGCARFPLVAERVGDPGKLPAVFVCRLCGGCGAGGDRVVEDGVGIAGAEEGAAGRAADRLRVQALAG